MNAYLGWGIAAVLWLQQFSPGLDFPFTLMSFFGSQTWFMLLLPMIYWCGDRSIARNAILVFLLSAFVNSAAKDLLGQPRPFDYDPLVRKPSTPKAGLPSGHTQNVPWYTGSRVVLSEGLAVGCRFAHRRSCLSRVYLGAHFQRTWRRPDSGVLSLAACPGYAPAAAWTSA
jgi:hypothetical protein